VSEENRQPTTENFELASAQVAYPSADGDIDPPLPTELEVGALFASSSTLPPSETELDPTTTEVATLEVAHSVEVETQASEEKEEDEKKGKPHKSFWREVLETIILTILIFFLVKSLVQNFRIQGQSMEPNFHTDQYILVNKVAYFHIDINSFLRVIPGVKVDGVNNIWLFGGPHRGDVIVFQYPRAPQDDYIKRVIGLPGDTVAVHNNIAYVNGKKLDEPYIKQEAPFGGVSDMAEQVVPPDQLFVLGDNRNGSSDSRYWGFLPVDNIIGKAWFDYWPTFKPGWGFIPEIKPNYAP
jgi:signal peptidase I